MVLESDNLQLVQGLHAVKQDLSERDVIYKNIAAHISVGRFYSYFRLMKYCTFELKQNLGLVNWC
ncbi:hypothetical protein LINGRAHAP2_LOCUS27625 [Linum grandiflorum]